MEELLVSGWMDIYFRVSYLIINNKEYNQKRDTCSYHGTENNIGRVDTCQSSNELFHVTSQWGGKINKNEKFRGGETWIVDGKSTNKTIKRGKYKYLDINIL